MKHRGSDPLAIKVADNLGLLYVGLIEIIGNDYYQFLIPIKEQGITFYVRELKQVKTRLNEKLREFGLKEECNG